VDAMDDGASGDTERLITLLLYQVGLFPAPKCGLPVAFPRRAEDAIPLDLFGYVPSPNPDGSPFWKKLKKMAKDCERPEKFLEVADLYEMLREAKASIMAAPSPEKVMGFLDVLVMLIKNQGAEIAGNYYGVQYLLGSAALVAEKLHRDMPETVEKEDDGKRMQHLARSLVRAVQSMRNSPEIPNTKASPQESIVAQPPAPTSASSAEMNLAYQTAPTSSAVGRVIKSAAQTETLDAALEQLDLQGSGANSSQTNLMATPPPLPRSSYFNPPPGAQYHPDGKPIGPFGPAKVKLPASWVLAHLDWTAVQLVGGSWAWFPTPVLEKNGYDGDGARGVPPPTVDNNDGLEGADDEDGLEDTNDEDANDDNNEGAIDEDNEFFDPDDEM